MSLNDHIGRAIYVFTIQVTGRIIIQVDICKEIRLI